MRRALYRKRRTILLSSVDSLKLPGGPKASLDFFAAGILRSPGQFATRLVNLNLGPFFGAGGGNRTRDSCLEGKGITTMQRPRLWAGLDLNQRSAFARQIYSLVPLTTRPPTHEDSLNVADLGTILRLSPPRQGDAACFPKGSSWASHVPPSRVPYHGSHSKLAFAFWSFG